MNRFRRLLAWLSLVTAPGWVAVTKVVTMGNQLGSARPGAVAAGGAAVGAGATAATMRGCGRSLLRALSIAEQTGPRAFSLSEDLLLGNPALRWNPLMTIDELAVTAARPERWESFSKVVRETSVARGISAEELAVSWRADPLFRSRVFVEISHKNPELLRALYDDLLFRYRSPFLKVEEEIAAAIKGEPVALFNASRKPLSGSIAKATELEYRVRAGQVFDEALREIPKESWKSEVELKAALRKAFAANRKAEYSFDLTTGKLRLRLKTTYGEVTGDINAYGVASKLAASGAGAWALSELFPPEKKTTSLFTTLNPADSQQSNPATRDGTEQKAANHQ